ncbi:MAG: hypothetical protein RQ750_17590 [Roseovarius sp.]|nr:hypothetical protein [Roseovarius sp.]
MRVPLRLRIRKRGDATWRNLPELHFRAAQLGTRRATIKFAWRDGPVNTSAASSAGWVEARTLSPGQAIAPNTDDWVADPYFEAVSGDRWITAGNAATSRVTNLIMGDYEAEFQLDRAEFPPGAYEVELRRGYAFKDNQYVTATYAIGGQIRDPFHFEGESAERIFQTQKNLVDKLDLVRYSSVWNDTPVKRGGFAIIAIRAVDTVIEGLSAIASGYVKDWDGTGWNNWVTTSNPAPHARDILIGAHNAKPRKETMLLDQDFLDLRADNFECNAIIEGQSVEDAMRIVLGTAFAQEYRAEVFGVIRDRDRSAETPVQIFTPQNMAEFEWSRGFPDLPDGFRATFADRDDNYNPRQIIHPVGASLTEQVTIEGLVTEAQVRSRLQYDLDTARLRSVFYSWSAADEAVKVRRGDLVGLATDALSGRTFTGRIADYVLDADGLVEAVLLDNEPDMRSEPNWPDIVDLSKVADMSLIGARFGLAIRRKGMVVTTHEVTASNLGDGWLDLVTPADLPAIDSGDRCAVGPLGQEFRRVIVIDMRPKSLNEWNITAVPEAPHLWQ